MRSSRSTSRAGVVAGPHVARIRASLEREDRAAVQTAASISSTRWSPGTASRRSASGCSPSAPPTTTASCTACTSRTRTARPRGSRSGCAPRPARNVVAFKTFLRTLIHELCHHLDYELYKLPETFHTEGFYKRESTLVKALLRAESEAADPQGRLL